MTGMIFTDIKGPRKCSKAAHRYENVRLLSSRITKNGKLSRKDGIVKRKIDSHRKTACISFDIQSTLFISIDYGKVQENETSYARDYAQRRSLRSKVN